MSTKTLNLSLPTKLLSLLDRHAKGEFASRSEYIRKAIINQIRLDQNITDIFNTANKKGKKLGITSEQMVYDIISGTSSKKL